MRVAQKRKTEVLLIQDDPAQAALITKMLSEGEQEFSVHHVRHPEAGLSLLQSRELDIVLFGTWGDGSGLEAALAVRGRAKSTPIMMIAHVDDEEAALKALQSDIQDYLVQGEITAALLKRSIRHAILRKRDMETQLQCEQWFAAFMLHLPAAAWTKDPMGRYVYGNKEHERVFSMPLADYAGKRDEEFLPLETARKLRENDARVLAEGECLQTMEALCEADGFEHHFLVNKFPIPGHDGRPAFVAGIGLDITERVRAEEALQKSERKFAKVFQEVPALLAISTLKEGRYVDVNETTLRALGYRRDEMIGRTALELDIWVDMSERATILQALEEKGSVKNIEVRLEGKSGQRLVGLFSAEYIELNGDRYVLSLVRDITDRKRAEEALQKSEKKFAKVFNEAPALLTVSTLKDGKFIDVNNAALQILGYRRDEMIGRTALELSLWEDPADRDRALQMLEEKGSAKNIEIRFRGKSGQGFVGLFSAEYIDLNGDRYMLSLVKDITEKKRAQVQVEQLNAELAAMAAELVEANRELEAFNYTVAHDLRKPLTTINGYCEFIREACGNRLDDQCKTYLQRAYEGTWRMNRLIDTLLEFSRLSQVEPRLETVDLSGVAREVAEELRHAEPERRGRYVIAEGISVTADPALLRVVLENLLGNAWKYAGIREEAVIEFGETDIDGQPAWFVRDNGPGFAAEDAGQLFIPFRRLPDAEKQAGFGIGLATVERIIRRHGGRIWAKGEPGKGATFYFTLG